MSAGHIVAQIRLVFQTVPADRTASDGDYLAYVEVFKPAPGSIEDGAHVPDKDQRRVGHRLRVARPIC